MADFEACYFCGRVPDGGLGEYAVVPRAFAPALDEQHSVVLCPTCRDKLTSLMKPVIEAAQRSEDGVTSEPPDAGTAPDSMDAGTAPDSMDAGTAPDSMDTGTPPSSGAADSSTDIEGRSGDASDEGGFEPEATNTTGGLHRDPYREAHQDVLGDDSETYNRVLRLLRNREFPVPRAEIEDVAANAYELDPRKVSAAIDTMIQKGLLVDQNGTLVRG